MNHLPIREQLEKMEIFLMDPYAYYLTGIDMQIVQHVYNIWDIYMNDVNYINRPKIYPHKDFFELLYSIKSNSMTLCNEKKKQGYPGFHLLGFLPLLTNGPKMLETILSKYCYSNAEEYIEFALLKLRDFSVLKRILLNNDSPKPNYNKPSMDINPWFLTDLVTQYPKILIDPDLQVFCCQHLTGRKKC
jgi:hypothetical protein